MPLFGSGPASKSKGGSLTWKCPYCGAENDDIQDVCDGCGDKRPTSLASSIAPVAPATEDVEAKPELEEPLATEPLASEDSKDEDEEEVDFETPEIVAAAPEPTPMAEPTPMPEPTPTSIDQRYYLVFVNTPAHSLIKSRVAIEFDDFPVVTIGRNPENIVVIPDPEVSRKHAQLSLEGSRVVLKDLKSSNGTYVYDGKEFQRVSDSVEVKPNTVIKFGTNTIVRLVIE